MKIAYRAISISDDRLSVVRQAETIARSYRSQGYDLTLRQLYYQFVARALLPNTQQSYKRLGDILNDARLAGEFDWDHIVDRTRSEHGGDASETTPADTLRDAAGWHTQPYWTNQDRRIEVWVEKEALAGVVQRAAGARRVTSFSCRGYTSASSMWHAAQRIENDYLSDGKTVLVLHLGDHDPSGIDMTRDITDRLAEFLAGDGFDPGDVTVRRIALNMDQVRQYNPPPNPAKLTDSRVGGYLRRFGDESWELDALDPATLNALILKHIDAEINPDEWAKAIEREKRERAELTALVSHLEGTE